MSSLNPFGQNTSQGLRVREGIAYAFGKIRNEEALEALHELLRDPESKLRQRAIEALAGDPRAFEGILECTRDKDKHIAWIALSLLSRYRRPEVVAVLTEALSHPDLSDRQTAAAGLSIIGDASAAIALPNLLKAVCEEDDAVRWSARGALQKIADASVVPALLQLMESAPRKGGIADVLVHLGGAEALNGMLILLKHQSADVRETAARALGDFRDVRAVPPLLEALRDESEAVRRSSAFALGGLKDGAAAPDLIAIVQNDEETYDMRRAAAVALSQIQFPR